MRPKAIFLALLIPISGALVAGLPADPVRAGKLLVAEQAQVIRGVLIDRGFDPDQLMATTIHQASADVRTVVLETVIGRHEYSRSLKSEEPSAWLLTKTTDVLGKSMEVRMVRGPQETVIISDDLGASRREAWQGGYYHRLLFSEDQLGPIASVHYDDWERLQTALLGGRLEVRFEYFEKDIRPEAGHNKHKSRLASASIFDRNNQEILWSWRAEDSAVLPRRAVEYLRGPDGAPLVVYDELLNPEGAVIVDTSPAAYAWLPLGDGPLWRTVEIPLWNLDQVGLRVDYTETQVRAVLFVGQGSVLFQSQRNVES